MSATDKLRRLLDERGVEYKSHYLNTSWYAGTKLYMAIDNTNGTLTVDNLTPEQAIAATVAIMRSNADRTCHIEYPYYGDAPVINGQPRCSECKTEFAVGAFPHYCPNCGARVVE